MICAQLGHSGGLGAHLAGHSLRMDKAVLWPRCGAVPIHRVVDRQPFLLWACRQINFWQYRISQTPTKQLGKSDGLCDPNGVTANQAKSAAPSRIADDLRFGSKADIRVSPSNVRFTPNSGHSHR
jgi:hypothetical protein